MRQIWSSSSSGIIISGIIFYSGTGNISGSYLILIISGIGSGLTFFFFLAGYNMNSGSCVKLCNYGQGSGDCDFFLWPSTGDFKLFLRKPKYPLLGSYFSILTGLFD